MTEGSFSIPITLDQRPDSAKAMVFPPAPANMSIMIVLEGSQKVAKSSATLLSDKVSSVIDLDEKELILRDRLGSDSKPSVVCHINAFIIK